MNKLKIIWGILGIIGFILTLIFILSQPSNNEICIQQYEKERKRTYAGFVTDKFIDDKEHNYKTLILNKQQTIWMNWDVSGLFEFLEVNDNVVKDSGSYEVIVYRDSLEYSFIINYGCDIN